MSSRQERIAEAIRQEASTIIHDKLKDPRLGFVTITNVEVTPDLRYAKIFFSVLGNDEARKNTKEALDSALGFVRKLVAERLNLRFAPEIAFYEDRSTEYSVRIEEILNEINPVRGRTPKVSDGCLRQPASNGVKELDGKDKPKKGRRGNKKI